MQSYVIVKNYTNRIIFVKPPFVAGLPICSRLESARTAVGSYAAVHFTQFAGLDGRRGW